MLKYMVVLTVILFGLCAGLYVHDMREDAAQPAVLSMSDQHEHALAAERHVILTKLRATYPDAILGDTKHGSFVTEFDGLAGNAPFTGSYDSRDETVHITLDRDAKNRVAP